MWAWLFQNSAAMQAVAAIVQSLFAVLIWFVTRRYVALTKNLVTASQSQLQLQRQTLRASLYEMRLKVFLATMEFLAHFAIEMRVEIPDVQKLLRETNEAEFLFEADVVDFVSEVRKKALEHRAKARGMDDSREAERRQGLLEDVTQIENWLSSDAFELGKKRFLPYLRFSEKEIDAMFEN